MKVLISAASELFTDSEPHGEGLICYEIVSRLAQRGHKLYVFTPQFSLRKELPNIQIYSIDDQAFASSLNPWKFQLESRRVAKALFHEEKVDIIHHMMPFYHETHFSWLGRLPLVIGPLFLPWELSRNSLEDICSKSNLVKKFVKIFLGRISRRMYYQTLKRAERILITVDKLRYCFPTEIQNKLEVIPFGVDTKQFIPTNTKTAQPTILFLANLLRRKGLQYLLQAMPEIAQAIPDVQLIVVGGGASEAYFRSLVGSLRIASHVKFIGPVFHNKTVDWFQRCDVYCLPSIGEPFGVSVLEAMSCGKAIVTTKAGGVTEFVEDGKSGYLVPLRDRQAITEAIIKILTNSALRDRMGKYNRELCIKNYDWNIVVDKIENVYREALPH